MIIAKHKDWLEKRKEEGVKKIIKGDKFFKLDRYQCLKYLNVENDTFHRPMCIVKRTVGEDALVEAIFTGSGLLTNAVRTGYVPIEEIEYEHSFFLIICLGLYGAVLNFFKTNKGL